MLGVLKFIKKNFAFFSVGAVLILLAVFFLYALPTYRNAPVVGEKLGTTVGSSVGTAIGSFNGITRGISAGTKDGREDGLSAKDTTVVVEDIKQATSEIGKLEILVAQVKLTNFHTVGDNYTALYFLRGDAIFTVDMGQATITAETDDEISILLPSPEMDLYISNQETEKVAEYQRSFFNRNTEDGFTAYLNSLNQMIENAEESIANYASLMEQARTAAINQVRRLASEICGSDRVLVNFK